MKMPVLFLFLAVAVVGVSCNRNDGGGEFSPSEAAKGVGRVMKKTKAMNDVMYLSNKVNTYKRQYGGYPVSLDELVEKGIVEALPKPPQDMQFVYDANTGKVSVQ